mgnify:CR=1 FL=1
MVEEDEVEASIDEDTAAVFCTQINYRTGRLHDMEKITRAAHAKGALVVVDLVKTGRKQLERYLGKTGAQKYLDFHVACSQVA